MTSKQRRIDVDATPCDVIYRSYACWECSPNTNFSVENERNKVSKGAKIRNRYNQVPHLTQVALFALVFYAC